MRAIGAASAVLVGALALSGCSSSSPEADESEGPVTITFAASILGEPTRGPLLQEMIDDFNASQDGITVEPASVPFSSFGTTIATQLGGGGGPDLIAFDHPNFFAAVDAGHVEPIDDIVDEDALLPGNDNLRIDGVRYGTALDIGNYALIYNPDLVTTVPTTFDELLAEAKAQTTDGVFGYAMRHTQAEEAGVWYDLSGFVYGFGGNWSDEDGTPTINSDENVEGVEAYKEMYDAGVIPQGTDAATYRKMFAEGKIAMMVDNGGIPTVIQGTNPDAKIAAAAAPLPSGETGQVMAVLGVNANGEHIAQTKEFFAWLLAPEQQARIQGFLGGSTAATKVERTAEELEQRPYVEVFDEAGENARSFVPDGLGVQTPQIRTIVVTAVLEALQNGGDIREALDRAQADVEGLL
jgi:multiple sugar transport system substrate-binding protein